MMGYGTEFIILHINQTVNFLGFAHYYHRKGTLSCFVNFCVIVSIVEICRIDNHITSSLYIHVHVYGADIWRCDLQAHITVYGTYNQQCDLQTQMIGDVTYLN